MSPNAGLHLDLAQTASTVLKTADACATGFDACLTG